MHASTRNLKLNMRFSDNWQESIRELRRVTKRTNSSSQQEAIETVNTILEDIESKGDEAVCKYTERFDGFYPSPIYLKPEILLKAWEGTPRSLQEALSIAHQRIKDFHKLQIPIGFPSMQVLNQEKLL